jgi:putative redox protein
MSHHITTLYNSGRSFTSNVNDHLLITDSHEDETHNSGPSPKRLMLVALAGCTGIDVVSILEKMKVNFRDFSIDVHASLSDDHPKIYKEVTVTYKIKIAEADRPKMERAVKLSEDKYCGVAAMFRSFATLHRSIIYNN